MSYRAKQGDRELSYQRVRDLLWVILLPLSFAWAVFTYFRRRYYPRNRTYQSRLKVVSVGNIHSGGSGKTPIVLEIARRYQGSKRIPIILSRGYGGERSNRGGRVSPSEKEAARLYGDEPTLLAEKLECPVFVGKNRTANVRMLETDYPNSFFLLDDGFQHLALKRDVDLLVLSAGKNPEDNFCLPLGDLREPITSLESASGVLLVYSPGQEKNLLRWGKLISDRHPEVPCWPVLRKVDGLWKDNVPYLLPHAASLGAFCGLAEPLGFRAMVESLGNLTTFLSFQDHCRYEDADFRKLNRTAGNISCWITTEKDWTKVRERQNQLEKPVVQLRIRHEIPEDLWYFLANRLELA